MHYISFNSAILGWISQYLVYQDIQVRRIQLKRAQKAFNNMIKEIMKQKAGNVPHGRI